MSLGRWAGISAVLLLSACGGGSGGDSGPNTTASLAGVYSGNSTDNDSGETAELAAVVAPNGRTFMLSAGESSALMYEGNLKGRGDRLSGSVRAYVPVAANSFRIIGVISDLVYKPQGTFAPEDGAAGSFNTNDGQTGTFALNYETEITQAGAALATVSGRWEGSDIDTGESASIDIAGDGSFAGSDSDGCSLSGQISIPDPQINIYSFTYEEQCPGFERYTASGLLEIEQAGESAELVATLSGHGVMGMYFLTKAP